MRDRDRFDLIKQKHGGWASWAVWAEPSESPKSNVGDLSVLDPDRNASLLPVLRRDIVMLGLNMSRPLEVPFANFHDANPRSQDFKIRYAFRDTPYYGAYMTDLVKGTVEVDSSNVRRLLSRDSSLIGPHVAKLLDEFEDLGCASPLLIAFGRDAHSLTEKHLPRSSYSRLVGIMHYSNYISQHDYRLQVLNALRER
jgi:hypothetical protein